STAGRPAGSTASGDRTRRPRPPVRRQTPPFRELPSARPCNDFGIKVMAILNGIVTKLKSAARPHRPASAAVIPADRACEGEPGPIEQHGRVAGSCSGADTRKHKDRAALDDGRTNGSRLGGRFAALAGMTWR